MADEVRIVHEVDACGCHRIVMHAGGNVIAGEWTAHAALAILADYRAATAYWQTGLPQGVFTVGLVDDAQEVTVFGHAPEEPAEPET